MKSNSGKMPLAGKLLVVLQILLGIGAVFGGGALIIKPDGALMSMPSTILAGSPFKDFLIPGIILFIVLGVWPLITAVALTTRRQWPTADKLNLFADLHWSWAYSLYIGFALIIWITLETFFIHQVVLIHVIYLFWGLAIQAVTLLPTVQKYYYQR